MHYTEAQNEITQTDIFQELSGSIGAPNIPES